MTALSHSDFAFVRDLVLQGSAIRLGPDQEYLVLSRLEPVARAAGFDGLPALLEALRRAPSSALQGQVIEAMTTNETYFFRDAHPFEALRATVLPQLIERRAAQKTLRIWSAACSSGQEPYSLAMLLLDGFPGLAGWDVQILGTDLSPTMLKKAQSGLFSTLEVGRGLPARSLAAHFERDGSCFRASARLRSMIRWQELNLAAPRPLLGRFDLILMRNVLIYFEPATREAVLRHARSDLAMDGYLMLGTTENLLGMDLGFESLSIGKTTVFRRAQDPRRMR